MAASLFAVGSYTEAYGPFRAQGRGVALLAFDAASGALRIVSETPLGPNPAYLRWRAAETIDVVLEADNARAALATLRMEGGNLRLAGRAPAPGRIPCHLDIDPSGRWLATACYGGGPVSLHPLQAGAPAAAAAVAGRSGASVHAGRQAGPHPHCVRFSPDGRWLVVADLGTDEILSYPLDAEAGALGRPRRFRTPAGAGPRLVLFCPDGRFLLLVEELASRLVSLRWAEGELTPVSACAATEVTPNTTAALRLHPSGRIVGVSNRGADSIALFRFDPENGAISPFVSAPSGGRKPRDLDFSPCGRWLLCANQDSDSVIVFALDAEKGRLSETAARAAIASPSCLRFQPGS